MPARSVLNIPLTTDQRQLLESWTREVGAPLAEELFVLAHAHNGERWVPLHVFAKAERLLLETGPTPA